MMYTCLDENSSRTLQSSITWRNAIHVLEQRIRSNSLALRNGFSFALKYHTADFEIA